MIYGILIGTWFVVGLVVAAVAEISMLEDRFDALVMGLFWPIVGGVFAIAAPFYGVYLGYDWMIGHIKDVIENKPKAKLPKARIVP